MVSFKNLWLNFNLGGCWKRWGKWCFKFSYGLTRSKRLRLNKFWWYSSKTFSRKSSSSIICSLSFWSCYENEVNFETVKSSRLWIRLLTHANKIRHGINCYKLYNIAIKSIKWVHPCLYLTVQIRKGRRKRWRRCKLINNFLQTKG